MSANKYGLGPVGDVDRPEPRAALLDEPCGETLRQRPEDQPLPVPNDRPQVADLVIADIESRRQLGVRRYGTPLQPHNGRDALRDAYEEALDLAHYLCQAIWERDHQKCPCPRGMDYHAGNCPVYPGQLMWRDQG